MNEELDRRLADVGEFIKNQREVASMSVRRLANLGRRPETLIVFGSEPDTRVELSPFASRVHQGWGLDSTEVIARRRAEEANASRAIGATVRLLPFHDAIYRGHNYLSDDDLFGNPAAAEVNLPVEIVASLGLPATPTDQVRVYAPLGIGSQGPAGKLQPTTFTQDLRIVRVRLHQGS